MDPTPSRQPESDSQADERIDEQLLESLERIFESSLDGQARESLAAESPDAVSVARVFGLLDVLKGHTGDLQSEHETNRQQGLLETAGDAAAAEPESPEPPVPLHASERLATGRRFGRFEILEAIGQGGHGLVFLARDPQLDRQVALKIPRPEYFLTDELKQRFELEARAAAALSHPNIVPVYESGQVGAVFYMATEFVHGTNLAEWIANHQQAIDNADAARIVLQLADAVHHAHQRGVLHRDLKPGNVLLRAGTPDLQPVITDFGLAVCADAQTDLTKTGTVVGTPSYMAPEQARGERTRITDKTDVYGLGTILYELLTGHPPFKEPSTIETVNAVINREPIAPRTRNKAIPMDLEAICLKCLEKNPDDRYATAHDLHVDLQRFLEGVPVAARPVTNLQRLARWAKRNRAVAGLSAVAVLLLLAALAATTIGWQSTRAALNRETRALENEKLAREKEAQAREQAREAVNQFYTEVADNELLDVPGLTPLRHRLLQLALGYYQALISTDSPVAESLKDLELAHQRVAEILVELGQPKEAIPHFQTAIDLQNEQLEQASDTGAVLQRQYSTYKEISTAYRQLNDWDQAGAAVRRSIDGWRTWLASHGDDDAACLELADALSAQSLIAKQTGDLQAAMAAEDEAAMWVERLLAKQPDHVDYVRKMATISGSRAMIAVKLGRVDEAATLLDRAIESLRQSTNRGERNSRDLSALASTLYNRAKIWIGQKQPVRAIPLLEEARELDQTMSLLFPEVARYHNGLANSTQGLAVAFMQTGQLERGVQAFRESLAANEKLIALMPDLVDAKMNLAQARLNLAGALGQIDAEPGEIRSLLEKAKDGVDDILEQDANFQIARILSATVTTNLAATCNDSGNHRQALEYADLAIAALEALGETMPNHPQIKWNQQVAWSNRGNALTRLDRPTDAVDAYRQALAISGPHPADEIRLRLAIALALNDQPDAANEEIERAIEKRAASKWPFKLARARALLLAAWQRAGFDDAEAIEAMAAAAVADLENARVAGAFDPPERKQELHDSADLAPLRDRADFQEFIARLQDR